MRQEPVTWTGLRFLTLRLAVRTDVPEVAQYSHDLFSRFLDSTGPPEQFLDIHSNGQGWRVRDGTVDASVEHRAWLPGIAAARILETVGNEVEGHELFHAAALARNGRGLILCGEARFGKSTLSVALLRRGWRFLSDEVAALDRDQGRLVPFPKAIEVRPEGARLAGFGLGTRAGLRGKIVIDADDLVTGCLSPPCPPAVVVFLEDHEADSPRAEQDRDTLRLVVHRRVEGLPGVLSALEGVEAVTWSGEESGCPVLEIRHRPDGFAAWRLDEVLGRHGVLVVGSSAEEPPPSRFDRPPRLEPLEAHRGVAGLLARFRGRKALARRIGTCEGGFSELFLSLIDTFKDVRFFCLRVGRLERMVALLERTLE